MRLLLTSHYFFIIPIRLIRYSLSIKPFHHSSLIMIMVRARALLSLLSSPPFTLDSFYNGHMSALDMTSAKTHIRQLALQQVRSMPDRIKNQCDAELLQHFLCSDEYRAARTIATYMSLPHEFDTHPLIEAALRDGKCVLIPHTLPHLPHHRMEFCIYDHNHLQRSRMSIIEPEEKTQLITSSLLKTSTSFTSLQLRLILPIIASATAKATMTDTCTTIQAQLSARFIAAN